jgi:hypothetical protein
LKASFQIRRADPEKGKAERDVEVAALGEDGVSVLIRVPIGTWCAALARLSRYTGECEMSVEQKEKSGGAA